MTHTPLRIQLRRSAGYRKPAGAVVCSRPGKWGNLYRIVKDDSGDRDGWWVTCPHTTDEFYESRDDAVARSLELHRKLFVDIPELATRVRSELAGRDLCCWCRLCPAHKDGKPWDVECSECAPCHVDVLLRRANTEIR